MVLNRVLVLIYFGGRNKGKILLDTSPIKIRFSIKYLIFKHFLTCNHWLLMMVALMIMMMMVMIMLMMMMRELVECCEDLTEHFSYLNQLTKQRNKSFFTHASVNHGNLL